MLALPPPIGGKDGVGGLFARYIGRRAIRRGNRHTFLLKVVPPAFTLFSAPVLFDLLLLHYDLHDGVWSTPRAEHEADISRCLAGWAASYSAKLPAAVSSRLRRARRHRQPSADPDPLRSRRRRELDQPAFKVCREFDVPCEIAVKSAHRTPEDMAAYAKSAHRRGLRVIIAGAGGAAHLPGMVASHTPLPVVGVPVESKQLHGLDSLLSIVQMPGGVPVATVSIGGGRNAGLLAVAILATSDYQLQTRLLRFKAGLAAESRRRGRRLQKRILASA